MKKLIILTLVLSIACFLAYSNVFARNQCGPNEKIIALTFDDGPRPKILLSNDGLIDLLDQYNAKATFFLIGTELTNPQNKKAAEELFKNGHELENHTYSHSPLVNLYKKYGEQKVKQDIERASNEIFKITGTKPKFIRPPCWSINPEVKRIIESENLTVCTIPVAGVKITSKYEDVNSEDYCFATSRLAPYCSDEMHHYYPSQLKEYALKLIKDREKRGIYSHILVFHELSKSQKKLKELIPELQKQGYKFVRLDEYYQIINKGGGTQ